MVVDVKNVSIKYKVGDFRDIGIKEFISQKITGKYNVKDFMAVNAVYDKYFKDGDKERNTLTEFNSNNTELWTVEQVKEKLLSLQYIRDRLNEN